MCSQWASPSLCVMYTRILRNGYTSPKVQLSAIHQRSKDLTTCEKVLFSNVLRDDERGVEVFMTHVEHLRALALALDGRFLKGARDVFVFASASI